MSDKSRNFRSSYYDKVGFRSVEEKKSLEILLNESPLDREKLKKFCFRCILPSMYREYVWKVLLGVLPVNVESHPSTITHKEEYYAVFKNSIKTQFRLSDSTPIAEIHVMIVHMTHPVFPPGFELKDLETPRCRNLIPIASFFNKLCSSELIAYLLYEEFILHYRKYTCSNLIPLRENFETILKKEDEALFEHLKSVQILHKLPVDTWYERCFATVLHESSLVKVFDKVIGGSFKILPYVATALLVGNRHHLIGLTDASKLSEIFENITEDISDVAANKALDMLHFAARLEKETEQYRSKTIVKP